MRISTILDHIDSGHMALPEFQRGYVWNRDQVRGLFDSLYRRYPVGSLVVWTTTANTVPLRGDGPMLAGAVTLLLDGQQRMTTLYSVMRGRVPRFFDGKCHAFTGLQFHLETETFAFHQPVVMQNDPLWIDVTAFMQAGQAMLGRVVARLSADPAHVPMIGSYLARLGRLLGIAEVELRIEEVTGEDKSIGVVVDIFNRVNSGGTRLTEGDIALAKVCAVWPEARQAMKAKLKEWSATGYQFDLDWLLRSMTMVMPGTTVMSGEARLNRLEDRSASDVKEGLKRASRHIDEALNMIARRLGLDHDQVFFGRAAMPVLVRYLEKHSATLGARERDKLLFWFAQSAMWGRFSGSASLHLEQDLAALDGPGSGPNGGGANGGVDRLLEHLRLWHGGLRVEAGHFDGWGLGSRFYPVLYMLTRMGEAQDWASGQPLKAGLLAKLSRLEAHHIFAKAQLYRLRHRQTDVDTLANFCFLPKGAGSAFKDRLPEDYFPEIAARFPGALKSQWIPADSTLWKRENYLDFIKARQALLAAETNRRFAELLNGDTHWLGAVANIIQRPAPVADSRVNDFEDAELVSLNDWLETWGLPRGCIGFDHADARSGAHRATFDIAWPEGVQRGLSSPVAVVLHNKVDVVAIASGSGFRCFTSLEGFRTYVEGDILRLELA